MAQPSDNLKRLFDISNLDELEKGAFFSQPALNVPHRFQSEEISQGIDYLKRKIGLLQTLRDPRANHEEVKDFLDTYKMIQENLMSNPPTKPIGDFLKAREKDQYTHTSDEYKSWAQDLQEVYKETLSTLFGHRDIDKYISSGQIPQLQFDSLDVYQNYAVNQLARDLFMHQGFQNYAISQEIKEHQGKVNIDGKEVPLPDSSYEHHSMGKFFKGYFTDMISRAGQKVGHFEKMPLEDMDDCLDFFEQKIVPALPYTDHDLVCRSLDAVLKYINTEVEVYGYSYLTHPDPLTHNQANDLNPRQKRISTIENAFQEPWKAETNLDRKKLFGNFAKHFADINLEMKRSINKARERGFAITPAIQPQDLSKENQDPER